MSKLLKFQLHMSIPGLPSLGHAGAHAYGIIPGIYLFGGLGKKPQEAKREAEARTYTQHRREEAERERKRKLAELRAGLSDEALETLRHRAEEALSTEGVEHTHLGYEVLVKLKVDEFLDQEYMPTAVGEDRRHAKGVAVE